MPFVAFEEFSCNYVTNNNASCGVNGTAGPRSFCSGFIFVLFLSKSLIFFLNILILM